ncbi:MAG: pantoate--beta-alanine ligase [Acidobacteriota bacterium]
MSAVVCETIAGLRDVVREARGRELTVGVVPTMGALHEGHAELIRQARAENGFVVVTIFVNPIQFDRKEDLDRYPRDLATDVALCRRLGSDAIFAPTASEMYPGELLTAVEVAGVSSALEGEFRPGHFKGVATVVAKLLNIAQADRAYFGEKDAQQLAVIQKMAADLNMPVTIVPVATVREADGLALSSRNRLLTSEERKVAPALYRALLAACGKISAGSKDAAEVRAAALDLLAGTPEIRVQYLEVADAATMRPVVKVAGPVRVAAAVWLGKVRLIDNVLA